MPQLTRALSRYSFDPVPQASPAPTDGTRVADTKSPGLRTPAPGAPDPTDERAQLSMSTGENGRFRLTYSAPASVGALVEQALREAKDALFTAGTPEVTLADAMAEVASRSLGAVTSASRADRYRVYVHLDTDGGWIGMGARLPDHMIDRLTCNGVLQPVWRTEGKPVSVGRAARIVPERTRRLVLSRDRGCRFPGCVSTLHLEVHHVRHWRHGGGTDIDSLVTLCGYHHDRHHEGAFTISGVPSTPGGLVFRTRHGHPVVPVVAAPAFGPWSFTTPLRPVSNPVPKQPSELAAEQRSDQAAGRWSGALQVSRFVPDPPVDEVTAAPRVPMNHLSDQPTEHPPDRPAGLPADQPGWRGPTGEHLRTAYLHLAPDPPDRTVPEAPTGPASTPDPAGPAASGVDHPP